MGHLATISHAYRAGGGQPAVIESAVSGSKFSRGDLVLFIGSKVSKVNILVESGGDTGGIALSDSDELINSKLAVLLPGADDVFLADAVAGNTLARGAEVDLNENAAGRHYVVASTGTVRVVVVKGSDEVLGQSDKSRVLIKFIYHASQIDLS
jgi:hypothetical protein